VKSAVRSVKCEVELQMWHVKQDATVAECTHARAWLAHGACKFYRWESSYISLRQLPPHLVRVLVVYIIYRIIYVYIYTHIDSIASIVKSGMMLVMRYLVLLFDFLQKKHEATWLTGWHRSSDIHHQTSFAPCMFTMLCKRNGIWWTH
jgi:hypothetical protein